MAQVRFVVVAVALTVVMLLVVAGPVYGFDVPRVGVIAVTSVVLAALVGTEIARSMGSWAREVRLIIALSVMFAVWVGFVTLLGDAPRLSLHGQQSRFVGAVVLAMPAVLVAALPLNLRSEADFDRMLGLLAALLGVGSGYAIVQFLGLDPAPWAVEFGGNPVSFYGNPNFVGAVLCLGVPAAWWVWTRGPVWRAPAVGLALASIFAMYASRVRLGGIAAVAGVAVMGFALARLPWRRLQATLVAAVPLGGVVGGLLVVAIGALVGDTNGVARVSFWRTSARMVRDAPLVGQGIGRFEPAYRRLRAPDEVMAGGAVNFELPVDSSHAFVIDVAATGGLPTAVLWVAILALTGVLLARSWLAATTRSQRVRVAALAGLLGAHAVQSSISVPIVTTVWLGWFLVGLTVAVATLDVRPGTGRARRSRQRRRRRWTREEQLSAAAALVLGLAVAWPALAFFRSTQDIGLSRVAQGGGQFDIAYEAASSATERSPGWPQAWQEASRSASGRGDLQTARDAALQAIEIDEHDRIGLLLMREFDAQLGGPEAMFEWNLRLLESDPNGVDVNLDALAAAKMVGDAAVVEQTTAVLEQVLDEDSSMWEQFVMLRDG